MSTRHVFYALWPDNRQREQLREAINSVAKTVEGRPVERRNWHITLPWIGDIDERFIPKLVAVNPQVPMKPFRLVFDRLEFWPRPKVACLSVATVPAELTELVGSLNEVLRVLGVKPPDRTYRPHITVSRYARAFTTERLSQRVVTEWSRFELMESIKEPGGVIYRPVQA